MNFEQAAEAVKILPQKPTDDEMLRLYGLYKQATVGDVNTERPSFWDMVGKAKWDAWESHKGMDLENAKNKYIALVAFLIGKYTPPKK
jgi:diazepam-binding inhibitor (GABA receptor modulating acyl-CoA-binding protein)